MRQNPENNVGLLAIGGSKPRLVNTLTSDTNNLLTGFASIMHDGESNNFSTSLRIAHLALKHRISKNYRQRIVILVCSPLQETEQELVKVAKKLKKENVNVDIVNFGEDEVNVELLAKFIETLNGKSQDPQCNLVNVPAGGNLNDGVRMSRICGQEANTGGAGGGAGGMDDMGGEDWMDDPNMDPDLALALRVSLEESRARQQQEAQASQPNVPSTIREENASQADADATTTVQNNDEAVNAMDNDDEMLMQALQMSLAGGEAENNNTEVVAEEQVQDEEEEEEVDYANMTEEQQIEYALKMSLQENNEDDDMKE